MAEYKTAVRAAAYARYSTANQHETSIAAQIDGIQAFCEREGITVCGMPYIDEARSGTNTDRPGFQRLLRDAKARKFDAVVVYDISRGSRDVADWFSFRKEMAALGIRVLSATNTLGDMDDPNAFLSELLAVGLGQHMVLQSRQKSIAGKRIRAERGMFCGGIAPLGYRIENGEYIIDDDEAQAVRLIFERYAAGASYGEIIDELGPFRTRTGKRLERNTLYFILKNIRYTGTFIWFDREERHMHKHVGRDNEDKIIIEGKIPAIISKELFEMCADRMAGNKNVSARAHGAYPYLLSGLIHCGDCGSAVCGVCVTAKGHKYPKYICIGKRRDKLCHMKDVKADVLDEFIWDQIRLHLVTPEMIDLMAKHYAEKLAEGATMKKSILDEMKELERRNHHETDVAIRVGLTPDLEKRLKQNEQYRQQLEAHLAAVEEPPIVSADEIKAAFEADLECFRGTATPEQKREIIHRYIREVIVYQERIEVTYAPLLSAQNDKTPIIKDDERLYNGWLPR